MTHRPLPVLATASALRTRPTQHGTPHDRAGRGADRCRHRGPDQAGPRNPRRDPVRNGSAVPVRPLVGTKSPGHAVIIPIVDRLTKVSLRIITMLIQSQGIITKNNFSVDISAVAYFRVIDAVKSVVAIENIYCAIDQIAQTTLRKMVGKHSLDEMLAEMDVIKADIRKILDVTTIDWGVEVTLVELKDIQLPESMKRAIAKQAEAEREKRAKFIAAESVLWPRRL